MSDFSKTLHKQASVALAGATQKNLADMVRGMRAHKKNENQYISMCITEIRDEVRNAQMPIKAVAIQKLTYLYMMGYDISWASFNIVEVMSTQKFTLKRIGYEAAAQCFRDDTDVAMLTTQMIRKDMSSQNPYEAGMALNALANYCTIDLARDLAADVVATLNSGRPYVRKRAVLTLYRIFLRFPDALRPAFPRLKEKLEDPDMSVVGAAVSVVCELARKNPKNYLSLAPLLFKLLTTSSNNWMLIKIIKLMGALTPLEPRLAKKLVEPLTNIINSTSAMSLLYECINTCSIGLTEHVGIIRLCLVKLRTFVENPDQNLKYLGLVALGRLMLSHPRAVQEHKDLVLWCLDDEDLSIRSRALELLGGMVNKKTLGDIVAKLQEHLRKAEGDYKDELLAKIIELCSMNTYANITDFEWYLMVLVDAAHATGTRHGPLLAAQFMDVVIRVKVIRPAGVDHALALLKDSSLVVDSPGADSRCEVLGAAAWIAGEFHEHIAELFPVVESLVQPNAVSLPGGVKAIYMHNVLKLLAAACKRATDLTSADAGAEVSRILAHLSDRLPSFTHSPELEAQERACFALAMVDLVNSDSAAAAALPLLFADPLNPVRADAQQHVPIPEGLDLEQVINHVKPDVDDFSNWGATPGADPGFEVASSPSHSTPEDLEKARVQREQRQRMSPYYIGAMPSSSSSSSLDEPPVETLTPAQLGLSGSSAAISRRAPVYANVEITRDEELPEGVSPISRANPIARDALSAIDLTQDLTPDEALPVRGHRVVAAPAKPKAPSSSSHAPPGVKGGKKKGAKKAAASGVLVELDTPAISSPAPAKPKAAKRAAVPTLPPISPIVPLASDQNVSLSYELKVTPSKPNDVLVEITVQSLAAALSAATFRLQRPVNPPPQPLMVRAGDKQMAKFLVHFEASVSSVPPLGGKLTYTLAGSQVTLEFSLTFPVSAFILAVPASVEQVSPLLSSLAAVSGSVAVHDVRAALMHLTAALHLHLVNSGATGALLYGRTVQGDHVLLTVTPAAGALGVEVKTPTPALSGAVLAAVSALFA